MYSDENLPLCVEHEELASFLRAYSISEFEFEPINQGVNSRTFHVRSQAGRTVLKIYGRYKTTEEVGNELCFQNYLHNHGLPVPFVFANRDGKLITVTEINGIEWRASLLAFVTGETKTEYSPRIVPELAQIHARMHMLGVRYAETIPGTREVWSELSFSRDGTLELNHLSGEAREFARRAQAFRAKLSPTLPHGFNHLDLDLWGNVIVQAQTVAGIIDFGDLAFSPCAVCLGNTLWAVLLKGDPSSMGQYLTEYMAVRSLTNEEYDILPVVMLFQNYRIGLYDMEANRVEHADRMLELERIIPGMPF